MKSNQRKMNYFFLCLVEIDRLKSNMFIEKIIDKCADYLATYAIQLEVGRHLLKQPPDVLQCLLHEDEIGTGLERLISIV